MRYLIVGADEKENWVTKSYFKKSLIPILEAWKKTPDGQESEKILDDFNKVKNAKINSRLDEINKENNGRFDRFPD